MFEVESTNYLTCGFTRHTHDLSVRERERERKQTERGRESVLEMLRVSVSSPD